MASQEQIIRCPPAIDTLDLHFKLLQRTDTVKSSSQPPPTYANLVAVANTLGVTFVGTFDGFIAVKSSTLSANTYPRKLIPLRFRPTHLAVNCDETLLAVGFGPTSSGLAYIYDLTSITTQGTLPVHRELRVTSAANVGVCELVWNPGVPSLLSACLSDGSVIVIEIKQPGIEVNSLPPAAAARCLCWSPKGKQLVIGGDDGRLTQFKPDMTPAKAIPAPPLFGNNVAVVNVLWVSNFQFAAFYRDKGNPEEPPVFVIVNATKKDPVTFINYQDITYGSTDFRCPQFYFYHLSAWNLIFVASANSVDVAVLRLQSDGNTWEQWQVNDSSRAELPLSSQNDETYPLGLAIDLSSQAQVPWPAAETVLPPMPRLLLLSHEGRLCLFDVICLLRDAPNVCNAPSKMVPDQFFDAPVSTPVVVSEPTPPKAPPTAASVVVSPIQQPPAIFKPTTPSQLAIHQPVPTKALSPLVPTVNFPLVKPIIPASGQLFQISPVKDAAVSVQKVAPVLPQLQPVTPIVKQVVEIVKDETATKPSNESEPEVEKNKISKPEPVQENVIDDDVYNTAIMDEMNAIDQELDALLKENCLKDLNLGSEEQFSESVKKLEALQDFERDVEETTVSQGEEVSELKMEVLEWLAKTEDARLVALRLASKLSTHYRTTEPLDRVAAKSLRDILTQRAFIETQLSQLADHLDRQWEEYQHSCRKEAKDRMETPLMEDICKTLDMQRKVLGRHKMELNRLQKEIEKVRNMGMFRKRNKKDFEFSRVADLSMLANSLLALEIENSDPKKRMEEEIKPELKNTEYSAEELTLIFDRFEDAEVPIVSRALSFAEREAQKQEVAARLKKTAAKLKEKKMLESQKLDKLKDASPKTSFAPMKSLASKQGAEDINNSTQFPLESASGNKSFSKFSGIGENLFNRLEQQTNEAEEIVAPATMPSSIGLSQKLAASRQVLSSAATSKSSLFSTSGTINTSVSSSQAWGSSKPSFKPQSIGTANNLVVGSLNTMAKNMPLTGSSTTEANLSSANQSSSSKHENLFKVSTAPTPPNAPSSQAFSFSTALGNPSASWKNTMGSTGFFSSLAPSTSTVQTSSVKADSTYTNTIEVVNNNVSSPYSFDSKASQGLFSSQCTDSAPPPPSPNILPNSPASSETAIAELLKVDPLQKNPDLEDNAYSGDDTSPPKGSVLKSARESFVSQEKSAQEKDDTSEAINLIAAESNSTGSIATSTADNSTINISTISTSISPPNSLIDSINKTTSFPSTTPAAITNSVTSSTFGKTVASSSSPVDLTSVISSTFTTPTVSSSFNFGDAVKAPSSFGSSTFGSTTSTAGVTSSSVFSTPSTQAGSIFGSAFSQATPINQASIFGAATTTSQTIVFGTPTVTTQASIFGAPIPSTQTSVFGTPTATSQTSVFGTPSTTSQTSVFGTSTSTTLTSVFGSPSTTTQTSVFGTPTATTQTSVFGTPSVTTQTSVFGTPTTTTQTSVFGTPTTTTQTSVFGTPTKITQGEGVFGTSTSTTQTGAFGTPPTTATSGFGSDVNQTANLFGQMLGSSAATAPSNVFGQATPSKSAFETGGSIFGATPASTSSSLFGTPNSNVFAQAGATNLFGGVTSPSNIFAQSPATTTSSFFGQAICSPFGSGSAAPNQSPFGNPATTTQNAFGGSTFGSKPAFGQSLFAQSNNNSSSIFGGSTTGAASGSVFGGNNSGSAFQSGGSFSGSGPFSSSGSSVAQTGFGSSGSFSKPSGGFGGTPVFGSTSPSFGSSATFGGAPTFGSPSAFGSPQKVFGSPTTQANPAFGQQTGTAFDSLANQNTVGFGSLAQMSGTQSFGSSFSAPSNPTFGTQQPGFGGSSFSSWR